VFLVNVPIGIALFVAAARVLNEAREPEGTPRPDVLGALLLTLAIGSLTLGIVKGHDWGWGGARAIGVLGAAIVLLAVFAARSARHPTPVIEPELVKQRSFAFANLAGLLFFLAFGAMLLSSVLFLTGVWHESVIRAGLQIAPGPGMAALFAVPAGRLADRYHERIVGAAGGLLFALGGLWWITHVGTTPHYAADLLPGMAIGGAGVGLVIPSLFGAATASLPPNRFATGTAITSMSRQIGVALGVAVLVAVLGAPGPSDALAHFQHGWAVQLAASAAAVLAFLAIGRPGYSGIEQKSPRITISSSEALTNQATR
jgi:MFS family permease